MPGLDKTGPAGQGSQTGRNLGKCSTENSTAIADTPGRRRQGRGFGNRFIPESEELLLRGRGFCNQFGAGRNGHGRRLRQGRNTNTND